MNVLFVPSGYPNELYPLANSFLKEQAVALAKAGHKVIILNVAQKSFKKINKRVDRKITVCNSDGVIEYKYWIYTFLQEKCPDIYVKRCEKALNRLFLLAVQECGQFDVVYAHFGFYAGYVMGKLGKSYNIPVVIQEHYSYLMENNISKKILNYEKEAIVNSTFFCCVSNNLRKSIEKNIPLGKKDTDKLLVLENMLDTKFEYKPLVKKEKFSFLSVGNLNSRKNFDLLIEAFCLAFDKQDNVELRIGGTGEKEKYLHNLVKKKGREHQIIFLGLLSRDEVFNENETLTIFDPKEPWKKTVMEAGTYTLRELMVPLFKKGECVYESKEVMAIRDYCASELDTLWNEVRRLVNPHKVYVDLSQKLYDTKLNILKEMDR